MYRYALLRELLRGAGCAFWPIVAHFNTLFEQDISSLRNAGVACSSHAGGTIFKARFTADSLSFPTFASAARGAFGAISRPWVAARLHAGSKQDRWRELLHRSSIGNGVTNCGSALETNSSAGGEGTLVFVLRAGFRWALAGDAFLAREARLIDFRVEVFLAEGFFCEGRLAFLTGPLARLAITFFAVFRFAFLAIVFSPG